MRNRSNVWCQPVAAWLLCLQVAACARAPATSAQPGDAAVAIAHLPDASAPIDAGPPPPPPQIDEDGDDDPEEPGGGTVPTTASFEKIGAPPMALTRICDLTPFKGALYMAHANQPLGTDGATITKYTPDAPEKKAKFAVAFDWNRSGEPTKGGGAGQGFLRAHAIDGRLLVTDADPPYGGLGLVDWGTEGYVFISSTEGKFAPPRAPHYRPPGSPDLANDKPGAGVLPHAYHVIDTIRFRGELWASTGSVPPSQQAWRGASPGALHRASKDGSRWTYETDYPFPYQDGVWRLTYMVRFKDRLYAGIQDYDGRDPNDYLYITPKNPPAIGHEDMTPVRVTKTGAAGTLRWWVDRKTHQLYWIAWGKDGVKLRVTKNGDDWTEIPMPEGAGRPTDITRWRDSVVVLTERGLFSLANEKLVSIAPMEEKKSPFELGDFFCAAPLAVLDGALYAGGQRGGVLYRIKDSSGP